MSTLAHVFEAEGMATVALGSIRKQIESTAPPRGLWCDFPLGRPLGKPGDPEFQHRVLEAAFALLDCPKPTVIEFGEAIHDNSDEVLACPTPPRHDPGSHPAVDEARGLRPAYDRGVVISNGRFGAGRVVAADDIPSALEAFIRVAEGTPWTEAGIPGLPMRVSHDIRSYYETAALAMVDHAPAAWASTRWFLDQTEAGKVMMAARQAMQDQDAPQPMWFYLTPGDR
ncbi:MAG TPA: hypothetical protein DGF10_02490 [Acidimicrobiaceae bacterium]|nr:hypothetical protein [Acidimicrobiaceae bacterium]